MTHLPSRVSVGARVSFLACMSLVASMLPGLSLPAHAEVITDWSDKVVAVGLGGRQIALAHTRSAAIVHVAMFDTLNSIDRRYARYGVQLPAAPGTSREAAAAAAAHFALVRLYPSQVKDLDVFYQKSLAAIADGDPKA